MRLNNRGLPFVFLFLVMAMVTQKYQGTVCIVMGIAVAALKFLLSFVKCT